MTQFKTLQFPATLAGQKEKIRTLESEAAEGWRVVSETVLPGKFKSGKACCLFRVCTPGPLLAGHADDTISITLQKDSGPAPAGGAAPGSNAANAFDRAKWNALLQYDPDIAAAAERVRPLGPRWGDELAAAYLALGEKKYLPDIVARVSERARIEGQENAARLARDDARKSADRQEQEPSRLPEVASARASVKKQASTRERVRRERRPASWSYTLWGTSWRKAVTIAIFIFLVIAIWFAVLWFVPTIDAAASAKVSPGDEGQPVAQENSAPPAAVSPSFDCSKVRSPALKMVCATPDLAASDQELAATYGAAIASAASPAKLKSDERAWLAQRNDTRPDPETLRDMYRDRIEYLVSIAQQNNSSGVP